MNKKIIIGLCLVLLNFTNGQMASAADETNTLDANIYQAVVKIKTFYQNNNGQLILSKEGSGVMVNGSGVILTNEHVVSIKDGLTGKEIMTGYQVCLTEDTQKKPNCDYTASLIAKDEDTDIALLKINQIAWLGGKTSFSFLPLATSTGLPGDTVKALGYPALGGETITVTSGIISGQQEKFGKQWLKTDAVISFGSSGGALLDNQNNLIGIPTQVKIDSATSLGYAVSVASIQAWLNNYLSATPKESDFFNSLNFFTQKQINLRASNAFTSEIPAFMVNKPNSWEFDYEDEQKVLIGDPLDSEAGKIALEIRYYPFIMNRANIVGALKLDYARESLGLAQIKIKSDSDVVIGGVNAKKLTLLALGTEDNLYAIPNENYLILIHYTYGEEDKDQTTIEGIVQSYMPLPASVLFSEWKTFETNTPHFSLKAPGNWRFQAGKDSEVPLLARHKIINEIEADIWLKELSDTERAYTNEQFLAEFKKDLDDYNPLFGRAGIKLELRDSQTHYKINNEFRDALMTVLVFRDTTNNQIVYWELSYHIPKMENKYYLSISLNVASPSEDVYKNAVNEFNILVQNLTLKSLDQSGAVIESLPATQKTTTTTTSTTQKTTTKLSATAKRLKGKLLLQVEDKGRIWYVNPTDGKRYEITQTNALEVFRRLALGINTLNLSKIAISPEEMRADRDADGDGFSDLSEAKNGYDPYVASNPQKRGNDKIIVNKKVTDGVKGNLLLDVEGRGRIWYVDFNGRRHEVTVETLMTIFRKLSLGIKNKDLGMIEVGN